MRFQSRKFTCGPAAICNALEVYKDYRTEDEVANLCKTTVEGTSPRGIVRGIVALGYWPQPIKWRDSLKAIGLLDSLIVAGTPAILCVDSWSHWIALVGKMDGMFITVDSADNHLIQFSTPEELATRWKYTGSRYEGFAVERKQ